MWEIDKIKDYVKENLKVGRYNHTLGVVNTAVELAKIFGEDQKKAEIAALCHDVAKNMDLEQLRKIIDEENITLSIDEENTKEIWHSIAGPIIAKNIFKINDEEILSAMRWHTTGKENMSNLDKIVYLADLIEPSREFDGIDEIRSISYKSLDLAMIKALTHTTIYLLNKGYAVDINTIKARNYLLYNKNKLDN
ncbi:bis(5'-nucleosyl)-tetraphosphatase (symmetrical) YqeK [Clostridium celatum]|uniref:bis(5'-nucleosyl)-tetraphosphatase (symmetrical) YqeK n=1 Tax=Clostridium celatum TaxID=36834 RepID=UPI0018990207|nr:bis(5'-nucleosyl)-tetraphosphatase (symmetrical) YqeK [Clostridium celatum]MDU2265135.1 bis(5'-nucleosyl)-tetraphosphatase (symmetrical) YqeK [Clostridium celatum]MDU6295100.1 bis(5'-nucleosyl)-tetraphosphatase (symmetrical) YqeK [Clostridium celatum]